jgi:hypothetical protein
MSTALAEFRSTRDPLPAPEADFTPERLEAAIKAARVRCADGPLEDIWVDIFEAEHLLQYRFGILGSLERLTRALEDYATPLR